MTIDTTERKGMCWSRCLQTNRIARNFTWIVSLFVKLLKDLLTYDAFEVENGFCEKQKTSPNKKNQQISLICLNL